MLLFYIVMPLPHLPMVAMHSSHDLLFLMILVQVMLLPHLPLTMALPQLPLFHRAHAPLMR